MRDKKQHRQTLPNEELQEDTFRSISATDCTGLISSMPESREQLSRYNEVYSYLPDPVGEEDQEMPETKPLTDREETKSPDKREKQDKLKKELGDTEHDRLF